MAKEGVCAGICLELSCSKVPAHGHGWILTPLFTSALSPTGLFRVTDRCRWRQREAIFADQRWWERTTSTLTCKRQNNVLLPRGSALPNCRWWFMNTLPQCWLKQKKKKKRLLWTWLAAHWIQAFCSVRHYLRPPRKGQRSWVLNLPLCLSKQVFCLLFFPSLLSLTSLCASQRVSIQRLRTEILSSSFFTTRWSCLNISQQPDRLHLGMCVENGKKHWQWGQPVHTEMHLKYNKPAGHI